MEWQQVTLTRLFQQGIYFLKTFIDYTYKNHAYIKNYEDMDIFKVQVFFLELNETICFENI